jgi:hypothetical protein
VASVRLGMLHRREAAASCWFRGTRGAFCLADAMMEPMRCYRLVALPRGVPWRPGSVPSPGLINNRGEVVASVDGHLVLWDAGLTLHVLPSPHGFPIPRGINENGSIVGDVDNDGRPRRAFACHQGSVIALADMLPGTESTAYGINEAGLVTGTVTTPQGRRPYLYNLDTGQVSLLNPLPGHSNAGGFAINNPGHVLGFSDGHACLWREGRPLSLGVGVHFVDLNDADMVVGHRDWAPCWANANGQTAPTILGIQARAESATAVNNNGTVIGSGVVGSLPVDSFVYFPPGDPENLLEDDTVLLQNGKALASSRLEDAPQGWTIRRLNDINDAGLIVGHGTDDADEPNAIGFVLHPYDRLPEEDELVFLRLIGAVAEGGGGWGVLPGGKKPVPPHEWKRLNQAEKDRYVRAAAESLEAQVGRDRADALLREAGIQISLGAMRGLQR